MDEIFEPWSEFNVAMAGATAALAGLVIVAASVNIRDIIASRSLTARLGAGVAELLLALMVSAFGLIPNLSLVWFGVLVLVATAGTGIFQVFATRSITADTGPAQRGRWLKVSVGVLPLVAYLLAGVLAVLSAPAALHFVAVGTLLAIVSAVTVSWVALVEVLR
jgi:hypothetical protein